MTVQAEQPPEQLPVAARPSMLPCRGHLVAGREIFYDFDVGNETGSCKRALEQVMAEERVLGDSPAQRILEGIDVVNSLARERTFSKQILVDVGDRENIRVEPSRC